MWYIYCSSIVIGYVCCMCYVTLPNVCNAHAQRIKRATVSAK